MLSRVPFAPGERYEMMWGCCGGTHNSPIWQNNGNDYYAGAGTVCVSPVHGVVVRAGVPGIGQGMRVGIQGDGFAVYMAHMHRLRVGEGDKVTPGQPVGEIWPFPGMPDHLHFSTAKGTYASGAFVDPWDEVARLGIHVSGRTYEAPKGSPPSAGPGKTAASRFYVEELPMPEGQGPRVYGPWAPTAAHRTYRDKMVESMRQAGRIVAPMQDKNRSLYIYEYAPNRYGKPFRWGPWSTPEASAAAAKALKADDRSPNPRRFAGAANSLYPWT